MKKFLAVFCGTFLLIGIGATVNATPITFDLKGSGGVLTDPVNFTVGGVTLNVFGYRVEISSMAETQSPLNVHQGSGGLGVGNAAGASALNKIGNDIYTGGSDTGFLEFLVFQRPTDYVFRSITLTDLASTEYAVINGSTAQGGKRDGGTITHLFAPEQVKGVSPGGIVTLDLVDNGGFNYLVVATSYQQAWSNDDPNKLSDFRVGDITLEYVDHPVPAAVPEPATMFLLGSGLIGIGVFVRRKFKK